MAIVADLGAPAASTVDRWMNRMATLPTSRCRAPDHQRWRPSRWGQARVSGALVRVHGARPGFSDGEELAQTWIPTLLRLLPNLRYTNGTWPVSHESEQGVPRPDLLSCERRSGPAWWW
jgi:hypothetical protein